MIKLTSGIGKPFYLSPELIVSVTTNEGGDTELDCNGDTYFVDEAPEEVARKVLDYKMAMARYFTSSEAAYFHRAQNGDNPYTPPLDQNLIFNRLAGLEESQ